MAHNPPRVTLSDDEAKEFRKHVMESKWDKVIEKYKSDIRYHNITVVGKGTALHIATNAEDNKEVVRQLVNAIIELNNAPCLKMMNERGDTPLHIAAFRGFTDVCELIIGEGGERKDLIKNKNKDGETPLFWTVCGHKILVYIYLQQFHPCDFINAIDKNETSILHIAVQRDMFDLAIIIMHFNEGLISKGDKEKITPLAYLATRRSAFYSGSMLPWWKKILYFGATIALRRVEGKITMDRYRKKDIFENNKKDAQEYIIVVVGILEKEFKIKPSQKFGSGSRSRSLWACTPFQGENTWRISGFALQMMWDIKWYKYIKTLVPDTFIDRINTQGKTPSEIFKEDHKELLQKSVEWMRDTAESCSVVAALIAGVSFATSGSVPGGNQQSGEPSLEGQPAFEGFAISSLIGLYFSIISLIMFLSILTSRKEVEDFCLDLPMKLLLGLSSLFVSIVSMLVSFCAGHFFVLTDKYAKRDILFYLYVSIFLPVAFYAFVQFPLFLDLVLVIFKKVPPPSIKGVLI